MPCRYYEHELLDETNPSSVTPPVQSFDLIDLGLRIERLVLAANQPTQGLAMIFFIVSIASLVVYCYMIIAYVGLSDMQEYTEKYMLPTCHSLIVILFLSRIYSIMASGQRLTVKVKQSKSALEDNIIKRDMSSIANKIQLDKVYLLYRRLEVYQYLSAIEPYAIFTLSNKTFCAVLGSTITYMVVLLKLRGLETCKGPTVAILNNTTEYN